MSEGISADMTCPRCCAECVCIAVSASRGKIMVCDGRFASRRRHRCIIPVHDDTKRPLLWFYDFSRLWESFDEPEGEEKPHQIKVIWAQKAENIDHHPDSLPSG